MKASLVSKVRIPKIRRFISHRAGLFRSETRLLVGLQVEMQLLVYDLGQVSSGSLEPSATFPAFSADWASYPHSLAFAPDLSLAVRAEPACLRAVDAAGNTLWHWDYQDSAWEADERGTVAISVDGKHVWAVVPGPDESQALVVLDCAHGTLAAQVLLFEGRQASANVRLHPDGCHIGLTFIEPDLCTSFWACLRPDSTIHHWDIESDQEVILDVAPTGKRIVTANMEGYFIGVRDFPDGALVSDTSHQEIRRSLGENVDAPGGYWSHSWHHQGGFIDRSTVIAAAFDKAPDGKGWSSENSHWLIDAQESPGTLRSRVQYSEPGATQYLLGLGDGTWVTADDEAVYRWSLG